MDTESHFMPLLDAMKILQVDDLWIVGFVHGFDRANIVLIGKNLEKFSEHKSYLEGKDAGRTVAARFVKERSEEAA